ncbi:MULTISPECIES: DUF917 domain-containing protein [Adlercreutzia]|jgi:hypothetical protein|uniref:DUF917 domain-containing protein n=2 Tax=Adlercreutzia TaxID=447020 RepID=A0A7C8BQ83_9ACTN|nr:MULTISPECIES: DUF917 domain-containing protein [Adlercreutzia]MCI9673167.1 DUF917 domain-containing protein [Enterorhabdus sp.]KAB1643306.1 DUF917 domain-containing protein [Adlercreutzia muris]MCR2028996.1 DUF917 domain-containing protein [Adlercreutzia muris]MCR2035830.1 DUF917 domain-containing protein [Adlercreutzia mucosicola]MCU7584454.1 DUF917 domain-containing protein [Adlercreutzia muris]
MRRFIGVDEIEDMALGATVLGAGGGGDPYVGKLMAIEAIRKYGDVELITPDEVPDDAVVVVSQMMGAPTIMVEKICSGLEPMATYDEMVKELGVEPYAIYAVEAGGVNSTIPFILGATRRIPVVDCDLMGRAFPELQMTTLGINGVKGQPAVLADEKGNTVTVRAIDDRWLERIARQATSVMGGYTILASYMCTGRQLKDFAIPGTPTLCEKIGRTLREAREMHADPIAAVLEVTRGHRLFKGKVVDVERNTDGMFVRGRAVVAGLDDDKGRELVIEFQNENIIARADGRALCTSPDLIMSLDMESGTPVTTEGLKYGARIVVVGMPCDDQWRTPEGLAVVGPRAFGYDLDYVPVEELAATEGGR